MNGALLNASHVYASDGFALDRPTGDPWAGTVEVVMHGPVGAEVRVLCGEYDMIGGPVQTVRLGLWLDDAGLRRLLGRARELGLDVVDVRRIGGGVGP
jgi:hypothetical protein